MNVRHKLEDWGVLERRPRIVKLSGHITAFGNFNKAPETVRGAFRLLWQLIWRRKQ